VSAHLLERAAPNNGYLMKRTLTADYTGNLLALDPGSGKTLWHVYAGGTMSGGPMTYELDGRQYLLTGIGSVLFAWSLPVR
jgi:alcohol dehydrogenase (cytochrome c)